MPRLPNFKTAERDDFSIPSLPVRGSGGGAPGLRGEALDAPSPASLVFPRNDTPVVTNGEDTIATRSVLIDDREQANAILSRYFDAAAEASRYVQQQRADDLRRSSPSARSDRWPSTTNGSAAKLQTMLTGGSWLPVFSSVHALPCVDRHVRRGVMFARKKAGKGYRRRKRRNANSNIWC